MASADSGSIEAIDPKDYVRLALPKKEAVCLSRLIGKESAWNHKALGNLKMQYAAPNGAQYQEFLRRVQSNLPGTLEEKNYPTISVGEKGVVEIKIKWKSPSDQLSHQIMMSSIITE
jgi:hypothetical protein